MCTPEIMLLFNVLYAVNIKKQIIKMLSTIIINKLKIDNVFFSSLTGIKFESWEGIKFKFSSLFSFLFSTLSW